MNEDSSFDARGWLSPPGRWSELRQKARDMRRTPTAAEARLWSLLRGSRFGVRFRRQHAIGQFIVDFYCASANLVLEVDGSSHDGRAEDDAARQEFLEVNGLRVHRFSNEDVLQKLAAVEARIVAEIAASRQNLTP